MSVALLASQSRTVGSLLPSAFLALLVAYWVWRDHRARLMLRCWAFSNGITVVVSERRWLVGGLFRSGRIGAQIVFRVTVEFPDRHRERAYVRCGNALGLLTQEIAVTW